MSEPIIEFEHFSFKYKAQQFPTLNDINLKIYPGEKILIVGQSGSGKSTLANCLNALIPCSYSGEVNGTLRVCGKNPGKLGVFGMSQIVGTVLQDTDGQFIALTVAEDIAFALENDDVPQDEMVQRVAKISEKLELTDLLDYAPGAMSGGQKQKVSIGGVMVSDVKILLFDEPLANLDPATGKSAIKLIDDISKNDDVTIVIIEHRLEDALYRDVDRIILMGNGTIVADMRPDDLLCSNLLSDNGIREPLYISAIKASGAKIQPSSNPRNIEIMDLEPYKEDIKKWFYSVKPSVKQYSEDVILEVKNLCFRYDKKRDILNNVSFKLRRGEMVALVGKNGAGKTTLSSLICGFLKPVSGDIYFRGQDISGLSIKERGDRIGIVMQSPNQMISKPMISEEVGLGLKVREVPDDEIEKRVNETLKICGLYQQRNWPVSALSFGQKKRLTIASILVMNPELIILDEPTAGQDFAHYTEIMEFLKELRDKTNITILMITHDMHLMLEYTDRTLVLTNGNLIKDAPPFDILTDENTCEAAYLKKTSLYDLAVRCGIENPPEFAARFIDDENRHRRASDRSKSEQGGKNG
ncbi:ABC transporter ATP-binding protein [Butyrivibrio sp. WCE2006]|uniref:ABC transporter ATP-binding protein n=1 Tax=Butyrivibrio sp. WCE2006 TaxID=1410611 RepID=UPI0005D252B0|nr:ABC transporter ATP-binding protein [Butyrivibrio sp. WCE2006]